LRRDAHALGLSSASIMAKKSGVMQGVS
jgi:hypothetical protein